MGPRSQAAAAAKALCFKTGPRRSRAIARRGEFRMQQLKILVALNVAVLDFVGVITPPVLNPLSQYIIVLQILPLSCGRICCGLT